MGLFSNLFGGGRNERVQELLNEGAVIIDVRTKGEFQSNHVQGSKNIPLPELRGKVKKIKAMNKRRRMALISVIKSQGQFYWRNLFRNWTIIRLIKLGTGLGFTLSYPKHEEYALLFIGVYFLFLAIFTRGCSPGGQCDV